jgi:hypothetical protein
VKKQNKLMFVKETLLSEIEELEERLTLLKKRVTTNTDIGIEDGIVIGTGKITRLVGQ